MRKAFLKCLGVVLFVVFSNVVFASHSDYIITLMPITQANALKTKAPTDDTTIFVLNFTNESIYLTSPLPYTIPANYSARIYKEKYQGYTPVRFTNGMGQEIWQKNTVFYRSLISVELKGGRFYVFEHQAG